MSDSPQSTPTAPVSTGSPAISWSAHEFEKKDRHPDWLWTVGLVFGLAAVVAFFYGSIFFGIFLVIAGTVMIIYALREPKLLNISFEEKDINVNGESIPYDKIVQFWLDETDKPDKLLLRVKGSFMPTISLPLEDVSAERVRVVLKDKKVLEEEIRESTSVKIFDRLGF